MKPSRSNQIILRCVAYIILCLMGVAAHAQNPAKTSVYIIHSKQSKYEIALQGVIKGLKRSGFGEFMDDVRHVIVLTDDAADNTNKLRQAINQKPKAFITIGEEATNTLAKLNPSCPIFFCGVPENIISSILSNNPKVACFGNSSIPPLQRALESCLNFFPTIKNIYIPIAPENTTVEQEVINATKVATKTSGKVSIKAVKVSSQGDPFANLKTIAKGGDCFWILPTSLSGLNFSTKQLAEFSQTQNLIVIGMEKELIEEGVILSISADMMTLGENTGKIAGEFLVKSVMPSETIVGNSKRYLIAVNLGVVKRMGLTIEPLMLQLVDYTIK